MLGDCSLQGLGKQQRNTLKHTRTHVLKCSEPFQGAHMSSSRRFEVPLRACGKEDAQLY